MELPQISDGFRLLVWVLVGLSAGVNVFLGNVYEDNLSYFFKKLAKKTEGQVVPDPAPWYIAMVAIVSALTTVVGSGFADSAPSLDPEIAAVSPAIAFAPAPTGTPEAAPTNDGEVAAVEEVIQENLEGLAAIDQLGILSQWLWDPEIEDIEAHEYPSVAAYSLDGTIAAGFPNGSMALFSVEIGEDTWTLVQEGEVVADSPNDRANDLLFMPTGNLLIKAGNSGILGAWPYSSSGLSGSAQRTFDHESSINTIALSTDGTVVSSGMAHFSDATLSQDSRVSFNNPASPNFEQTAAFFNSQQNAINDLTYTVDGQLIAVGNAVSIQWYQPEADGSRYLFENSFRAQTSTRYETVIGSRVNGDQFYLSGDNGRVLLAGKANKEILLSSSSLGSDITAMAYHPSQDILVAATSDCLVYLLDATTLATLATSPNLCADYDSESSTEIGSIAFAPNGQYLIASNSGGIFLLNSYTPEVEEEVAEEEEIEEVDPSAMSLLDTLSSWFWTGNTDSVGTVPSRADDEASVAAYSPVGDDGNAYIAGAFPDGSMTLFSIDENSQFVQVGDRIEGQLAARANDMLFTQTGNLLITAGNNGILAAWPYSSETGVSAIALRSYDQENSINTISLSPDGNVVASGMAHFASAAESDDTRINFNEPFSTSFDQSAAFFNSNQGAINDLTFTLDGRLATVGNAIDLQWYQPESDGSRYIFENSFRVETAASYSTLLGSMLSEDQLYLSGENGRVLLIDLASETVLLSSNSLGSDVSSMALHPEIDVLAVGMADCAVHLLDAVSLATLGSSSTLCEGFDSDISTEIASLAFSPSGDHLVASNAAGLFLLNTLTDVLGAELD